MRCLRIIAADSSAAVLNDKFEALLIVASSSVLVTPPYREAEVSLAKPIFADARNGHEVIVQEAELCRELIRSVKADVVHIDMSLGAVQLEQLSPIQFSNMQISARAKRHLLGILPRLRKIANDITQKYGVDVLAIGKESIPVRIAELTSGAHAILFACERAVKEGKPLLLGLPSKCKYERVENGMYLNSLITAEHDVRGHAEDVKGILSKVHMTEMLNPTARGFRAIRIVPAAAPAEESRP